MNMNKLLLLILVLISVSFIRTDSSLFAQKDHNGKHKIQLNTLQNSEKKEEGRDIYQKHCLSCHQVDGSGVPGMFPPLKKSDWVNGDKKRIILVVLNGIKGNIIVNDETYSQVMPRQDYLTDEQIAKVLTFIRNNFGNKGDSIYPHEVLSLRVPKKP
jgi:mono/diheme cytochrome c family protein